MSRFAYSLSLAAAMAAVTALAACETPAKVSVLQSDSVLVQPGATYAWAPTPSQDSFKASADPRLSNTIIQERLRTAVDTAMAAKGYHLVDNPASAQLLTSYHVGLKDKTETYATTYGGGGTGACGFHGC